MERQKETKAKEGAPTRTQENNVTFARNGHTAAECHWKVSEVREELESSPSTDNKVSIGAVRERGSDMHTHVHHTNEQHDHDSARFHFSCASLPKR